MPQQLSDAEIDAVIAAAVAATGAAGPAGMGKVMAMLKPKLAGRADMARGLGQGQGEARRLIGDTAGRRRDAAPPTIAPFRRAQSLPIIEGSLPCERRPARRCRPVRDGSASQR